MDIQRSFRSRAFAFAAAMTVLCTAAFAFNPLQVSALPGFFKSRSASFYYEYEFFDINSQLFAINRVNFELLGIPQPGNGLGFRTELDRFSKPTDLEAQSLADARRHAAGAGQTPMVYMSTFFLQGDLWTAAAKLLHLPAGGWLGPLRVLSALLTALALLPWLLWLRREFGTKVAGVAGVSTVTLTGLTLFAGNLFRVPFMAILPFSVGWLAYPALAARGRPGIAGYGLLLFAALLGAFLCSLEFATVTVIAAMIPPLYFELKARAGLRRLAATAGGVLAVSVLSFTGAVVALAARGAAHTGSFRESFGHVFGRAGSWTQPQIKDESGFLDLLARFGLHPDQTVGGLIEGSMKIMLMSGVTLFGPIALPIALCCLIQAALFFWTRRVLAEGPDALRAFYLVALLAALSPFSWIVLQFAHIAHHSRFAPFLFAFPGLMMTFAWAAIYLLRPGRTR